MPPIRTPAGQRRVRYFFYGTLLDRQVQNIVIGRTIPARHMSPATVRDHRRVYVEGAWYPTLVPCRGNHIDGYIVDRLTAAERRLIDQFEDDDYVLTEVAVVDRRLGETTAFVYMPPGPHVASDRDWTLSEWRRRHKHAYLRRSARWMISDFDQNW